MVQSGKVLAGGGCAWDVARVHCSFGVEARPSRFILVVVSSVLPSFCYMLFLVECAVAIALLPFVLAFSFSLGVADGRR